MDLIFIISIAIITGFSFGVCIGACIGIFIIVYDEISIKIKQ